MVIPETLNCLANSVGPVTVVIPAKVETPETLNWFVNVVPVTVIPAPRVENFSWSYAYNFTYSVWIPTEYLNPPSGNPLAIQKFLLLSIQAETSAVGPKSVLLNAIDQGVSSLTSIRVLVGAPKTVIRVSSIP